MDHSWLLDETVYAGAEHLDAGFVAGYDRKQGHPSPQEDIDAFVAHGLGAESTVVDLGAGTGQFSLAAAEVFGSVIAVDVSPAMVEYLESQADEGDLGSLRVVQAGFLGYEHEGDPADGVFTRNALHQLPDFWKGMALHRIARMMRPGGVLRVRDLVYDFEPGEAPGVFQGWFDNASTDPAVGYTAQDFVDHIRGEHSTYRWLFEPLLERAGFEIVAADYRARVYASYTCVLRG